MIYSFDNLKYKLLDLIPQEKIDWILLSIHPYAINLLEKNLGKIDWRRLSRNPNAIHILEKNLNKIHWGGLSGNPNAIRIFKNNIQLLKKNLHKLDYEMFSTTKNINFFIENHLYLYFGRKQWSNLSMNKHAIPILEKNLDKVDWSRLSLNENASHILEKNLDKVDWYWLSQNESENAIHILEKNLDKVDWSMLSLNKNAIHILEKNLDKINFSNLFLNSSIFVIDYQSMKNNNMSLKEELIQKFYHPMRLQNMCEKYNIDFTEIDEIY